MVTYRQATRGVVRTMRAIDREAKRAERSRITYEKAAQKQALLESSAQAAAQYEQLIEELTGAHRIEFERLDWNSQATTPPMTFPERSSAGEDAARSALSRYKPGWLARTFGLEAGQRAKLQRAVEAARTRDEKEHQARQDEVAAHNARVEFAQRVVALDRGAISTALTEHSQLGDLAFSLESIDVLFTDHGRIIAMVDALELEDMPDQSVTLLQSGKASFKALVRSRIQELHRDNICSGAIRVGLEFLQTLPVEAVEVVMLTDLLDPGTGHVHGQPVLYLRLTAQAVEAVNLARADPAALVERLGGHHQWSRKDGFRAINLGAFDIPTEQANDS